MRDLNSISGQVISIAVKIHMRLGPGLMEHVYEGILERELVRQGFRVDRQKWLSFDYDGLWFEDACRVDLMIDNSVIVEVKSARQITDIHESSC